MNTLQRELDWFHEALERDPGERAAFIEAKHADDPALVRRLLRLLEAHDRAERSIGASRFAGLPHPLGSTPERIGPYRILEPIGEGGMGVVYAAEQTHPLRRRVAIKVIKLGMDTREVLARFEAERHALAMMDHPGVAKALDAGVTDQGRPYFVMELVKGLPIGEYCAKHRLPLRERLRLFADVCAATQHAHQKGIIHRDLKPSNILVGVQEGRPVPKIIDFGVAKATAARLTEQTVFTEQGRLIGTPEYMSPEQAEMSGLDIDTRTDVYSLGVILYELLTGVLPFDAQTLRAGGYSEILRTIREVDPPRPSARLSALSRDPQPQPVDIATHARSIRGELDWIVMRAMAKDRTRRYGTASALAEDVERYLTNRPLLAGPPSATYAVRKFVRRHRYVTMVIALASLSLLAGVAGLSAGLLRAREAEALATRKANNAQAAADFLERVLFQADPEFVGRSLPLDELMQIASESIDKRLGQYPEVEATVRESMGVAYRRRSMFTQAAPHLRRSLEIRRTLLGEHHLATAASLVAMANLVFEQQGDVDQSLSLLRTANDTYASHDPGGLAEAWVQLDLGFSYLAGDRLTEAEAAFESSRRLLARHRGPQNPDVSRPVGGLALVALGRDDVPEAQRLARLAVALCEGEQARYIGARARLVLAQALLASGELNEAEALLKDAQGLFAATVEAPHIRIAELDAALSDLHLRRAQFALAQADAARCEAMRRSLLDENHPAILEARLLRQRASIGLGQTDAAEAELREIGARVDRRLGPDCPLAIHVARAKLDCAIAAGDVALGELRGEQLRALQQRRAERLRNPDATNPS